MNAYKPSPLRKITAIFITLMNIVLFCIIGIGLSVVVLKLAGMPAYIDTATLVALSMPLGVIWLCACIVSYEFLGLWAQPPGTNRWIVQNMFMTVLPLVLYLRWVANNSDPTVNRPPYF